MSDTAWTVSRRGVVGVGAGLAVAAAIGAPALARRRRVVVATIGGRLGEGLAGILHTAAMAATGLEVVAARPDDGDVDVVLQSAPGSFRPALAAERYGAIDPGLVPSAQAVASCFRVEAGERVIALGGMAWIMGLASAPDSAPPARWTDLWTDPRFAGRIALPRRADSGFLDVAAAVFLGGTAALGEVDGAKAAIERVAALAPRVGLWWRDEAAAERAVESATVAVSFQRHEPLGAPARTTAPTEGAPMICGFWTLRPDGPEREGAHAFLDFALHPETQGMLARRLGVLPTADFAEARLDVEAFATLTIPRAFRPNVEAYQRNGELIERLWSEMLADAQGAFPKFALTPRVKYRCTVV